MVHATINPSSLSTEKLTGTAKNHNKKQKQINKSYKGQG